MKVSITMTKAEVISLLEDHFATKFPAFVVTEFSLQTYGVSSVEMESKPETQIIVEDETHFPHPASETSNAPNDE